MRFSTIERSGQNPQVTMATKIGDKIKVERPSIGLRAVGNVTSVKMDFTDGQPVRIEVMVVGNSEPRKTA